MKFEMYHLTVFAVLEYSSVIAGGNERESTGSGVGLDGGERPMAGLGLPETATSNKKSNEPTQRKISLGSRFLVSRLLGPVVGRLAVNGKRVESGVASQAILVARVMPQQGSH